MNKWWQKAYTTACDIFSDEGFYVGDFNLKMEESMCVDIIKNENNIQIFFPEEQPLITFKRIIRLKVSVGGVTFNKEGGVVMLEFFPDIPFKYEWIED